MIGRTHAKKEISRLSAKRFFPSKLPAAMSEMADALQKGATDEEHATRVITSLLRVEGPCPEPAVILAACRTLAVNEAEPLPAPCAECSLLGGNWKLVEVEYKGQMVTATRRCDCERGRMLQVRESEHRITQYADTGGED